MPSKIAGLGAGKADRRQRAEDQILCRAGPSARSSGAASARTIRNRMKPPPTTTLGSAAAARRRRTRAALCAASRRGWRQFDVGPSLNHGAAFGLSVATRRSTPILTRMKISAEHQHQALDQRQVAVDHRIDRHVADAGIGEDALDDHRAADQERELDAGQRERRADRVAQRLLQDEPQLADMPLSRASST